MGKPIVVLGLGNPLMADEGIGVYLVERLRESVGESPSVEFVDAGTGGFSILHYLEGRRKAILVDCAFMDEPPGTIRRFTPEEVRSTKVLAHQSLHEADLLRILALARQLGQAPDETVVFGIQPERIEPGMGLSPALRDRIDEYIGQILHQTSNITLP
ncbi:MAG: hydrogenase maturation protease, partial [Planctomycetes bacterium]|nr:hydrogenase maturation protease [Planctomycetota bacterium]